MIVARDGFDLVCVVVFFLLLFQDLICNVLVGVVSMSIGMVPLFLKTETLEWAQYNGLERDLDYVFETTRSFAPMEWTRYKGYFGGLFLLRGRCTLNAC
ncbi:hypothetical protein L6452_20210 [Arctium lappa]|uniref:Uncharacterized protein n=1 Tax=Arctium lappa TaxID=4217 RepID=A0ACB9BCK9_ARCLA|nr:hypothetical protein L6452_20210 [Arctium lappa]